MKDTEYEEEMLKEEICSSHSSAKKSLKRYSLIYLCYVREVLTKDMILQCNILSL